MKNIIKFNKPIKILLLSLTSIVVFFLGLSMKPYNGETALAEKGEIIISGEWTDKYILGETFIFPKTQIQTSEGLVEAEESYLVLPNGNAVKGDTLLLNQAGTYTLHSISQNTEAEKDFTVYAQSIQMVGNGEYEYREQLNMTDVEIGGIGTTIYEGTQLKFTAPIDVSQSDLSTPIATVYPYNFTKRLGQDGTSYEVHVIIIRMTDAYDESNYVDIEISYDPSGNDKNKDGIYTEDEITYNKFFRAGNSKDTIVAGTTKDVIKGMIPSSGEVASYYKKVEYEGRQYTVRHKTLTEGAWGPYGSAGSGSNNADDNPISVYYENATKKVYAKDNGKMIFVTDLDFADAYDVPFQGFKTGEVTVSILGDWFKRGSANIEISEIYGTTGEALIDKFAYDKIAPFIDLTITNEKIGEVCVAKGEKVSLIPFEALDSNGIAEKITKVYYNYGSDEQVFVSIKDNGFVPKNLGLYTIVCGAYDVYGNYSEKYFQVNCIECEGNESLRLTLENDGEMDLLDVQTDLLAGKVYRLPTYNVTNANSFETKVNVYLFFEGDTKNPISVDENLVLDNLGEYTLVYEYGDLFQQKRREFKLRGIVSDELMLEKMPALSAYYIKGAVYTLDAVSVKSFATLETQKKSPDVFMSSDSGEWVKVQPDKVEISASETVKFQYRYNEKVLYETANIPVVDVNYTGALKMEKYFVGDYTPTASVRNIVFLSNKRSGDNMLEFINPISFENFNLGFEVKNGTHNFKRMVIRLVDYYNSNNVLEIVYGANGTGSYFAVDGRQATMTASFVSNTSLSYQNNAKQLISYSGETLSCDNPFTADKVMLSIVLEGISGDSAITISRINSQTVSNSRFETVEADMSILDIEGRIEKGGTLTVYKPYINDVLTPDISENFTMTVLDIDSATPCKDNKTGQALQNVSVESAEIVLEKYGTYTVVYTYVDGFGNVATRMSFIVVTDDIKPEMRLTENYTKDTVVDIEYGKKVTVSGYRVLDNETSEDALEVSILVIMPDNDSIVLESDLSFVPTIKGVYTIYYVCYDEAGNYTTAEYKVNVK